jgi:hypothetical protein
VEFFTNKRPFEAERLSRGGELQQSSQTVKVESEEETDVSG